MIHVDLNENRKLRNLIRWEMRLEMRLAVSSDVGTQPEQSEVVQVGECVVVLDGPHCAKVVGSPTLFTVFPNDPWVTHGTLLPMGGPWATHGKPMGGQ